MAETSSGNSTYFKYEAVENICEQMTNVVNNIKTQLETIRNLTNNRNSIWRGEAADRFWQDLILGKNDIDLSAVEDITNNTIPEAINSVIQLVEDNKAIDSQLMTNNNVDANNANDNVQANNTITNAAGVDQNLNQSVGVNDNIQANSETTNATGVDEELNQSVGANDNIHDNVGNVSAEGIDSQLINGVEVGSSINSSSVNTNASGIDSEKIDNIEVGAEMNSNKSVQSNDNDIFSDIMSAYSQVVNNNYNE